MKTTTVAVGGLALALACVSTQPVYQPSATGPQWPDLVAIADSAAAARHRSYQAALDSWMGADIGRLLQSWGAPSSTFKTQDGKTLYTWDADAGAVAVPIETVTVLVPRTCRTTFTVASSGRIGSAHATGNTC